MMTCKTVCYPRNGMSTVYETVRSLILITLSFVLALPTSVGDPDFNCPVYPLACLVLAKSTLTLVLAYSVPVWEGRR